jgi:simple sugar transport system ATP-binding protein
MHGGDRAGGRVEQARPRSREAGGATRVLLEGIGKSFVPGRPVLHGVDLAVAPGEIHALLGENGAGKSTLMNVLIGLVRPDTGRIAIDGRPVDLARFGPAAAAAAGIAMVHQHSTLIAAMTVEENLCFGDPRGGPGFDPGAAASRVRALADRYGLEVPTGERVEALSVGQRQRAEIIRALDRGAGLLILDEPTAALTPSETDELFPALRRLRDAGRSVIFISHKLDEVEALADRVSVLRRGERVATLAAGELDARRLGRLMLGRELPVFERPAAPSVEPAPPLLALRGVCAPGLRDGSALADLEVEVGAGEIVGIAGIDGNGQRELEEVLAGVRTLTAGRVEVGGASVQPGVVALRRLGVAHLSGDRERAGLLAGFTLWENWVLKSSRDGAPYFPGGLLDVRAAHRATREAIARFDITPGDPDADIATLSGGNAQKLAVARELSESPRLLVAVNPTRGLDVGSTRFVHEQLFAVRARGGGVLLISTELDEVLALADRITVLARGRLHPVSRRADRAEIGAVMLGEGHA